MQINIHNYQPKLSLATITPKLGDLFIPIKAGKKTSHVVFILDNSVSMKSSLEATISGFNEFLSAQKLDEEKSGIKTAISLFKFGGQTLDQVYFKVPVNSCSELNTSSYSPYGFSTNLRDGLGGTILRLNEDLTKSSKGSRESVMIVLLTDGQENSSTVFSSDDLKKIISKCEEVNWGFTFLGANIDAFAVGSQFGFNVSNTIQYNMNNITETMRSASEMSNRMKTSWASGQDTTLAYSSAAYTTAERTAAVKND